MPSSPAQRGTLPRPSAGVFFNEKNMDDRETLIVKLKQDLWHFQKSHSKKTSIVVTAPALTDDVRAYNMTLRRVAIPPMTAKEVNPRVAFDITAHLAYIVDEDDDTKEYLKSLLYESVGTRAGNFIMAGHTPSERVGRCLLTARDVEGLKLEALPNEFLAHYGKETFGLSKGRLVTPLRSLSDRRVQELDHIRLYYRRRNFHVVHPTFTPLYHFAARVNSRALTALQMMAHLTDVNWRSMLGRVQYYRPVPRKLAQALENRIMEVDDPLKILHHELVGKFMSEAEFRRTIWNNMMDRTIEPEIKDRVTILTRFSTWVHKRSNKEPLCDTPTT